MVDWIAVILAKKEVAYGTDAVPTVGANGILVRNFSSKPIDTDRIERGLESAKFGAQAGAPSNERRTSSYEVEIAGSGTAGTAPAWMELLEACGMGAAVLAAGVDAQQTFAAPSGASSLTQYDYISDQRRKTVGQRGAFTMDFTAGAYPFFAFNWTGLVPAATPFNKSAPGAVDLLRWKKPVEVNTANTDFLLDGFAPNLRSWKADAGISVNVRNLVGANYVNRGNHGFKSTAVIEAPDIATKDYIQSLRAGSLVAWQLIHGTVAGHIIELSSAKVEITDISESKEDDILMWTIAMTHTIDGGSADLLIKAK